ncbi:hypothetical protein BV22DRAFT_1005393 [Leucogyrophana mollusca]|uniref:Uncharacterized protein n=1 Tax=Leucogyrophana mollusca TaxID=85980 RepID=A0ACB8BSQ1_9AGAM|nr:hypothetical protein BV22DRAFT_1005393 [Leucogyrophana mollusca]
MTAEAFLLLSLPNVTLANANTSQTGTLALECVTIPVGVSQDPSNRGVYLVLRLNNLEWPVDPTKSIGFFIDQYSTRNYTIWGVDEVPVTLTLRSPGSDELHLLEDMDTFHELLAQYAELRDAGNGQGNVSSDVMANFNDGGKNPRGHDAMRGHLVLINGESGEVVGELDNKLVINEDPSLHEEGRESDSVLIELPDDDDARAIFVRAIPPEEQNWLTKSASLASHVISGTTNLLITTMNTASTYYINHSTPHPSAAASASSSQLDSAPPPRALVFLTSENTRKGLSTVHTISAQAATVSSKTVSLVDSMIKRAVGAKQRNQRDSTSTPSRPPLPPRIVSSTSEPIKQSTGGMLKPPLPPRSVSPSPSLPPYSHEKPALPPRQLNQNKSSSPQSGHLPSRAQSPLPPPGSTNPKPTIRTRERVLLSADLVLSSIDDSMRQFVDAGSANLGRAVEHKYGREAAQSAGLITGTGKNIVAVYIDMRGIGRRAIVKRAGKEFVKARLSDVKRQPS